jgi:phage shock protein E
MKNILLLAVVMAVLSCTVTSDAQQKVQAPEFEKLMAADKSAQIIDVRTPEEFISGHLPGARNINVSDSGFKSQVNTLDKTKTVLVYCASGVRSTNAAEQMKKMGFSKVYNLDGGIRSWAAQGKPIVQ